MTAPLSLKNHPGHPYTNRKQRVSSLHRSHPLSTVLKFCEVDLNQWNSPGGTASVPSHDRGDILVQGLWQTGRACISDFRTTYLDCKSYRDREPSTLLGAQERHKKKYLQACLENCRHFMPFVISTDGMMGNPDNVNKPYPDICGHLTARISLESVRTLHRCLRGSRVPINLMSNRRLTWEDGARIGRL